MDPRIACGQMSQGSFQGGKKNEFLFYEGEVKFLYPSPPRLGLTSIQLTVSESDQLTAPKTETRSHTVMYATG